LEAVKGDARLCLIKATTLQEVGRIDEANHWLEAALLGNTFVASDASTESGLAACQAINQYFRGDAAGIRETAGPALSDDSSGSGYLGRALLPTLGTALFVGGRGDEAALVLERAIHAGEQSGHALALIHALGLVCRRVRRTRRLRSRLLGHAPHQLAVFPTTRLARLLRRGHGSHRARRAFRAA